MSQTKLEYYRYDLRLKHTFTISRSSRDVVPVVLVKFTHEGTTAYGEASPNARYSETPDSVEAFLKRLDPKKIVESIEPGHVFAYLDSFGPGNSSAKCSIDIAVHDWIAKKQGVPLYRYFGAHKSKVPLSTFTIGIDTPELIIEKVEEAAEYPVLKIKLGQKNDEAILDAVRSVTQKPLRVDANEGWKSKEEALEKVEWLSSQNVELVEQPMPASQLVDSRWLRERSKIPLIADEALSVFDVPTLSTAYDGINIKLQKNGGLHIARKFISSARNHNLKIMLGCMIESSVGIAAAAHLSPLVDWNDLDGNVLISNDPFAGVPNVNGRISLNDEPGLGVSPAQ